MPCHLTEIHLCFHELGTALSLFFMVSCCSQQSLQFKNQKTVFEDSQYTHPLPMPNFFET